MLTFSSLLDRDTSILLDADITSRKRLFEEAAYRIALAGGCDKQTIFDALFAREKLGSTAIGNLVAIPHARVEGLSDPCLVLIRTKTPFSYDGAPEPGVQLIFAIAIPSGNAEEHLALLSLIAEFLYHSANRSALLRATSTTEIYDLLQHYTSHTEN